MESKIKNKAVSGVIWGGLGNFAQQLFNLVFGILLGRILSVSDYGLIGLLTIFSLIASAVQESGFVQALANREQNDHNEYNSVFWTSILIGTGLYLFLFFLAPFIADFYELPQLTPLARFLFLGILIGSTGTAHVANLFKQLKVRERALSNLSALIVSGIVGVSLAISGYAYWALAIQSVTYILCNTLMVWHFSSFRPNLSIDFRPARRLWTFGSKVLLANISNHVNGQLFSVFLGRFYGESEVGYFSQGTKWTTMMQHIVINASHGFAQPMFSSIQNEKERLVRVFLKLLGFVSFVSFPMLFCFAIVAEEFIFIAITDKWSDTVPIVRILCVSAAFAPLVNLYTNFILSKGKSSSYLINTLIFGIVQLLVIAITYRYGVLYIAIGVSLVGVIWNFVWQYLACNMLGVSFFRVLKGFSLYLIIALIASGVAFYVGSFYSDLYVRFIVKGGTMVFLYVVALFCLKSEVLIETYQYFLDKILRKSRD